MRRYAVLFCLVSAWNPATSSATVDAPLRDKAAQSLRRAADFFSRKVAAEGGYLWRYSIDLADREGEGKASSRTVWVQPPGTPAVGSALLGAFHATDDRHYLRLAKQAGDCLVRGQLRSGGWDYRIEFDPKIRKRYAYRVDPLPESGSPRNLTTLDDNNTQSAVQFLMRLDRAPGVPRRVDSRGRSVCPRVDLESTISQRRLVAALRRVSQSGGFSRAQSLVSATMAPALATCEVLPLLHTQRQHAARFDRRLARGGGDLSKRGVSTGSHASG